MEYDLTLFEKGLEELGIALSQEQKKQFITYYEYLVEKNKVMNLKVKGTILGIVSAVSYVTNPLGALFLYQEGLNSNSV